MEPESPPPKQSAPRPIPIDNEAFGYGNIEAWANIIRSYREAHPHHQVLLSYEGEHISNLSYLFKLGKAVNRRGFEMHVAAPDENLRQVPKLFRLLVEGAGPDYEKFLVREIHRTLKLF